LPVAAAAEVLVVVCRGEAASVVRVRERLTRLVPALANARGSAPVLMPVVVTRSRYGSADAEDLARTLAETTAGPFIAGVGWIALDEPAVARLQASEDPTGRLARSALMKSAAAVVAQLGELTTTAVPHANAATERQAEPTAAEPVSPWLAPSKPASRRQVDRAGEL
jgi:hypothetical protein